MAGKIQEQVPPFAVFWNMFVQATDPATDPANMVGPGKPWVETDDDENPTTIVGFHIRNLTNSDWIPFPIGTLSSGGDADTLDGHDSTYFATAADIVAAVAALVNSSPGTLDTLKELADALGDDPNFAATISAALAGKQPLHATLTSLAGLSGVADRGVYFTAAATLALYTLTAFGRSVGGAADAAALRTLLALGTAALLASDTDGTLAANDDARIATQKAVKTYVDALKSYVDSVVDGRAWKQPVRAATTAAGTLASSFENGDTIDGVVLATGDRILIKNQVAGAENGLYTVNASGAPTRATDADSAAEVLNATVMIEEGTTLADTQWTMSTNAPITLNTTALVWVQVSGGSTDVADETTLHKAGNTYSIKAGGVGPTEIAATAVTPGAYGDASNVGQFTVDADGRITAAANVAISGAAAKPGMTIMNGSLNLDTSGEANVEEYPVTATNDHWKDNNVRLGSAAAAQPTTKGGFYGNFTVPHDYTGGSAQLLVLWTSPIAAGDVALGCELRAVGGDDTTSLDQATAQETPTATDTAPGAVNRRMKTTLTLTAGNYAADDTVPFYFYRDGAAAADTLAGPIVIKDIRFIHT